MSYPWLIEIQKSLFSRIQRGYLHHGLLFDAALGSGEVELLASVAQALLCETNNACGLCKSCNLFNAQSHPDIKWVSSDKPSIGVDQIREVGEFATSTSQLLGNKVVVIPDIHLLTESASNSLLKTLEEPNDNTYLLLSSSQVQDVLATIKSRCEKIRISLPKENESLSWLSKQTEQAIDKKTLAAFSGSPLLYLDSLSNEAKLFEHFQQDLEALLNDKLSASSMAEKWQKEPRQVLAWSYQWAVNQYQNALKQNLALLDVENYAHIAQACLRSSKMAKKAGINKNVLLNQFFNRLKIKEIM